MGLKIIGGEKSFANRREAGRLLGTALKEIVPSNALVLGIPRGGVVVAAAVADALDAELDVVLSRKLGAPGNPELAIGAVIEGGAMHLNEGIAGRLGVPRRYIEGEKAVQLERIAQRSEAYRKIRPRVDCAGRNVIVVDDGVATGATMMATLHGLRKAGSASLWCALPVGPSDTLEELAEIADEVVSLTSPAFFNAVGQFYEVFDQTTDEEVLDLLSRRGGLPREDV